jgi:hypothetical protein
VKLVLDGLHGHAHLDVPQVTTTVSLAVVVLVLAATTVASLLRRGRKIESQPKEEQWPESSHEHCTGRRWASGSRWSSSTIHQSGRELE